MLQPTLQSRSGVERRVMDTDRLMDRAIAVGLTLLIATGFVTSYRTLCQLAVTEADYPPWLAPAVPISLDLGIVVLSLRVLRAAASGRDAILLRAIVATLALATVAMNSAAASSGTAAILHGVPPAMFVICFESVVSGSRRAALESQRLDWSRSSRAAIFVWLLAPRRCWRNWRNRMLSISPSASVVPGLGSDSRIAGDDTGAPLERRESIIGDALREHPDLRAADVRDLLADRGISVSLRTAQRLRSQFFAQLS